MDPEQLQIMAQLLSSAKGGNKNLSGLLGNLDNQLLLAMAGVIDPMAVGSGGGQSGLYNQFANDPSTPDAVKAILDYVSQGANQYQIESAIQSLPSDVRVNSGYTDDQLIRMANQMVRERNKGVGKNVFEKAGFRNPNDIYSMSDVPLTGNNAVAFADYLTKGQEATKGLEGKQFNTRAALNKLRQGSAVVGSETAKNLADSLKWADRQNMDSTTGTYVYDPNKAWLSGLRQDLLKASKEGGEVDLNAFTRKIDEYYAKNTRARGAGAGYDKDMILKEVNKLKEKARKTALAKYTKPAQEEYDRAMHEQQLTEYAAADARRKAEAVQAGVLDAYKLAGKTPFTDQMQSLLKFVQSAK